jgi:hypothetical protein
MRERERGEEREEANVDLTLTFVMWGCIIRK